MRSNYNKGFTLVETLIAISVLMIAIVGPLTVANKAYTSAIDARNQSEAIFLAQEAMEYIDNMKDNDNQGNGTWNGSAPNSWTSSSRPAVFAECVSGSRCRDKKSHNSLDDLVSDTNGISGASGVFTLMYYFTPITAVDDSQIVATVEVTWSTGNIPGIVTLQQILTNYNR